MDSVIKQEWLAALRSGKYEQTTGSLCIESMRYARRFCCLGVLCDILQDEVGMCWEYGCEDDCPFLVFGNMELTPPPLVRELSGLSPAETATIAKINDNSDSYEPAIDYIEEYL